MEGNAESGRTDVEMNPRLRIIWGIIIAVIIYLIILTVVFVPLQGGLISSTELLQDQIAGATVEHQANLPVQEVDLGSSGRSIFIAAVLLTHTVLANLAVGGSWIILATIVFYHRYQKMRYKNLARSLTLLNIITVSAVGTFGAAAILYFIALFPTFAMNAFKIWWWPFFAYLLFYGLIITLMFILWFGWDRISTRWHLFVGVAFAVATFLQMVAITMMGSGMLTPNIISIDYTSTSLFPIGLGDLLLAWYNPTLWQLTFHRLAAAISFVGFLTATMAMLHYRGRDDFASKKQWDWVAAYGLLWGLVGLIMQPVLGQQYMFSIMQSSPGAFQMIMHGPRAWEMLFMVGLFSGLVLTVVAYFISRRDQLLSRPENRTLRTMFWGFFAIIVVAAFILIQPAWLGSVYSTEPGAWINPIGSMEAKYVALWVMAVIGAAIVMLDTIVLTSEAKEGQWGYLSSGSITAAFTAGILGMAIVLVMGFVRESARSPWLVYELIPVPGGTAFPTPIPMPQILVVWAVVLGFNWLLIWYVFKHTSYQPTDEASV
jgi:cytochrome bd-type quinol oxidase subunit 1